MKQVGLRFAFAFGPPPPLNFENYRGFDFVAPLDAIANATPHVYQAPRPKRAVVPVLHACVGCGTWVLLLV